MSSFFSYDFKKYFNENDFKTLFDAKDGNITRNDNTGLLINSIPFSITQKEINEDGWKDHFKCFFAYKESIKINKETVYIETEISTEQIFDVYESFPSIYCKRIRNIQEDPRLASSGIMIYDPIFHMYYGFLCTNKALYALYGRMKSEMNTIGFADLIYLENIEKNINLKLGFLIKNNTISFLVNKSRMLKINFPGHRLNEMYRFLEYGGISEDVKSNEFLFCMGTFSFLDACLPKNYAREQVKNGYINKTALVQLQPENNYRQIYMNKKGELEHIHIQDTFIFNSSLINDDIHEIGKINGKLFGQGAKISISSIKFFYKKKGKKEKKQKSKSSSEISESQSNTKEDTTSEDEMEDLSFTTDCMDYKTK